MNAAATAPVDALKAEGYRSVFSIVEGWAWCPHCGLKREVSEFQPIKSVAGASDDAAGWHAVSCTRCHARGLLSAEKHD
ncbi:MAG: hypothetical protein P1V51_02410 [Deltaproteobacteria bacterium]|nr:hypothetical protein [Deltaproteobacteria bacterium]